MGEEMIAALYRAFAEMANDYVDDVWGRDLSYIASALGEDEKKLRSTMYNMSVDERLAWIKAHLTPAARPPSGT